MKTIILIFGLVLISLIGFGQGNVGFGVTTVVAYDMSELAGADTTIYRAIQYNKSAPWSTEVTWTGVTGAGTIALFLSNNGTAWYAQDTIAGELSTKALSGATGSFVFTEDKFAWTYLGWKLTKSTISAGTLTIKVNVKK